MADAEGLKIPKHENATVFRVASERPAGHRTNAASTSPRSAPSAGACSTPLGMFGMEDLTNEEKTGLR